MSVRLCNGVFAEMPETRRDKSPSFIGWRPGPRDTTNSPAAVGEAGLVRGCSAAGDNEHSVLWEAAIALVFAGAAAGGDDEDDEEPLGFDLFDDAG